MFPRRLLRFYAGAGAGSIAEFAADRSFIGGGAGNFSGGIQRRLFLDLILLRHIIGNMSVYRVVLDTNVLVAAARSRLGASHALLRAVRDDRFRLLASVPLFLEYEAVLKRPEHLAEGRRSAAMVDTFLDTLSLHADPVHLFYLWRPQLRDPADEMVLETALNGRADALVTFNVADFAAASRFGLPVWTPQVLLTKLEKE